MFRFVFCAAMFATTCSLAAPLPAAACSIIVEDPYSVSARRAEARQAVGQATAIIDAEVIRPFIPGTQNALVRAHRVLKGPAVEMFEVGERDSCDTALMNKGERSRMLLVGGPAIYFLPFDQSNARQEDRLLKSDRKKVWPYQPGEQPR